jgi:hypothetical protein
LQSYVDFNTGTNVLFFNMGDPAGSRGHLVINTGHGGSTSVPANTEWQVDSPGHIALGPGFPNGGGHFQFGIAPRTPNNPIWGYWQYAEDERVAIKGFSGAMCYTVSTYSSAGVNSGSYHPGMFGQQDTVNGGYYLDAFADIGVTGGGGTPDAWNPGTITPGLRLHFGNFRETTLPGSLIYDQSRISATVTQALSFRGSQYQVVSLPNAATTFCTTNRQEATSTAEKHVFILKSGANTVPLAWPAGWSWLSGTCATNSLPPGSLMRLELESLGTGESNVLAFAQLGFDSAYSIPFNPMTVSSLQSWYKADALPLGTANGTQTNWVDSSGLGRTAGNTSAGAVLPYFTNNAIGGNPAFIFTGNSLGFLTNGYNVADTDFTVFVVGRSDDSVGRKQIFDRYGWTGLALMSSGSSLSPPNTLTYCLLGAVVASLPQTPRQPFVTAFGRSGTTFSAYAGSGATNTTVAATALPTTCTGNPSLCGFAIESTAGGNNPAPGLISEVLYYNTALSSVNVSNVLGYLRNKYGLQ